MMTFMGSRSLSKGYGDGDASSVPGGPGNSYLAAEQQRALVHAEQAERFLAVDVAVGDADAVVADLKCDVLLADRHLHVHPRRARVARHVGEDLLEDAEHGGRDVDVELHALGRQLGAAADAGALLGLLRPPAHRGAPAA